MSARPTLGLLVDGDPPQPFVALVRALAAWSRPASAAPEDDVQAWLASSPDCHELPRVIGRRPVAIWAGDEGALSRAVATCGPSDVVVSSLSTDAPPPGTMHFPANDFDVSTFLPLSPAVRARWRTRLGLPEQLVVSAGDDGGSLPSDLLPTGFALASAVVARSPQRLLEAMAWGAPCVTDPACAAEVGAVAGVDVLVRSRDFTGAAAALSVDEATAARLGRSGRRRVETDHDDRHAARAVALALGLIVPARLPATRVRWLLDELRTPVGSALRDRVHSLVSS